jgi:signal-transduction protein with cAMP-binding, CBS, and nucleotidyltransferase domain
MGLVGVLTRGLVAALAQHGRDVPVERVMKRDFRTIDSGQMLEAALVTMQTCECETLPVMRGGKLAGLLTKHNVGEFLAIQSALELPRVVRAASCEAAGHADAALEDRLAGR